LIAFLTGRVAGKAPTYVLLDVGGVGYQLSMSTSSLAALPAEGDVVTIHTHLHVREDELSLFGFESSAEKDAFELLLTVTGVGPKVALAVCSALSPGALAHAIGTEDVALISSVPGIGKKTAQRIILDLADKLGNGEAGASPGSGAGAPVGETKDALLAMGFSSAEVAAALKGAPDEDDASALLKYALRRLGGGASR